MGKIFNYDNKFFSGMNKAIDVFLLSLLFLLTCIPVFTIGAALSAVYYTMNKQIVHSRGYLWSTYWGAFKSNFKNSTITWLIQLVISIFLSMDLYITYQLQVNGNKFGILFLVFLVLFIMISALGLYCYGYLARFEQTRRIACKTAIIIGIANLGWTLLIAVILTAVLLVIFIIPATLFLAPAIGIPLVYVILEHVFKKYMRPEDIQKEIEEYRSDY